MSMVKCMVFDKNGNDVTDKNKWYIDANDNLYFITNDVDKPFQYADGYTYKVVEKGLIRRFDDLGSINIPKEVRRQVFGKNVNTEGKPMEIFYEEDGTIILRPCKDE